MNLFKKIKENGWGWFIRRAMGELMEPTTKVGHFLKPFGFFAYYLISRPFNFFCYQFKKHCYRDKASDTLYLVYDLDVRPITYDFCWVMAMAEAKRREFRLDKLAILFVPGRVRGLRKEEAGYEAIIDENARRWRIYAMMLPATSLLPVQPAVHYFASRGEALLFLGKYATYIYPQKYNTTFSTVVPKNKMNYTKDFMSFRSPVRAREYVMNWLNRFALGRKPIVITLRQYDFQPQRNSNIQAWADFASQLDPNRYFVVIIPDVEKAFLELPDALKHFTCFESACWNITLRAALYELAYLNLGVNNGPMALCWLNAHCRYLCFKVQTEGVFISSAEHLANEYGFCPNENPAFCNRFQKWVWVDDSVNVILKEFQQMCERIEHETQSEPSGQALVV